MICSSNIKQARHSRQQRVIEDNLVAAGAAHYYCASSQKPDRRPQHGRQQALLFTTDSDAPRCGAYSSSNTDLGREAGKLILKALPNGGKCVARPARPDNLRAHRGREGGPEGLACRAGRRAGRRDRPDPCQAQCGGHAGRDARRLLPGRLLLLQHPSDLRGAEGSRQARPDQDHRLRRGSDHAWWH